MWIFNKSIFLGLCTFFRTRLYVRLKYDCVNSKFGMNIFWLCPTIYLLKIGIGGILFIRSPSTGPKICYARLCRLSLLYYFYSIDMMVVEVKRSLIYKLQFGVCIFSEAWWILDQIIYSLWPELRRADKGKYFLLPILPAVPTHKFWKFVTN